MTIHRRTFLTGLASALAAPAIVPHWSGIMMAAPELEPEFNFGVITATQKRAWALGMWKVWPRCVFLLLQRLHRPLVPIPIDDARRPLPPRTPEGLPPLARIKGLTL